MEKTASRLKAEILPQYKDFLEMLEKGNFEAERLFRENREAFLCLLGSDTTEAVEREMKRYHFHKAAEKLWQEFFGGRPAEELAGMLCRTAQK